jgi:hypothetical protein
MSLSETIHRILGHRRVPLIVTLLAVFLCLPSLWLGLQNDDHYLRLVLTDATGDPDWTRSPVEAFSFVNGDEELMRRVIESGRLPWWTHPRLRLAFLRPVTSFTHWIDFRLWPGVPWLMHVQSLIWFAGAVAAAAVLYRRLLLPSWVAGLAALLFAVDDAHGMPAVWIANRNASIGVFFGLLALIAHDRWRRDGSRLGAWLAPLALLLGLLSGEIALAAGGYLFAYALFFDTGGWQRRLGGLVPGAVVGAGWWFAYRALDFGASGSGVYIDPGASPFTFTLAVIERAPVLLFGQWGLPSGIYLMLSQPAAQVFWVMALGLAVVLGAMLLPMVKRDRTARFFALGMVLSLIPACATFPDDRLLFFAGFGGMGLLAQLMASIRLRAEWLPSSPLLRSPFNVAFWSFVVIHLVFAPIALAATADKVRTFGTFIDRAAESLPSGPEIEDTTVLIVNTPTAFLSIYGPLTQGLQGRPVPGQTLILGSGIYPTTISRPSTKVLTIRPDGGFLAPPGSPRPGHEAAQAPFHPSYFFQMLDRLYRDTTPMKTGERIAYGRSTVEITEASSNGRPLEVSVHFDVDLEHPSLRWIQWREGVYVPFDLPAVGETVILPSVVIPW